MHKIVAIPIDRVVVWLRSNIGYGHISRRCFARRIIQM